MQVPSFRFRAWPLALVSLIAAAAVAAPLVLIASQTTRIVVGAVAVVAVAAIGWIAGARRRDAEGRRRDEQLRDRTELEAVELRYQALVDALPLVTWLYEPGDRSSTFYASPAIEGLIGYTAAEWAAEPDLFTKLLHPDDRERVFAEIERARESDTPLRTEYRVLARDGRVVWVREETTTVRGLNGLPLYTQTFLRDIEARKRAESSPSRALVPSERSPRAGAIQGLPLSTTSRTSCSGSCAGAERPSCPRGSLRATASRVKPALSSATSTTHQSARSRTISSAVLSTVLL